MRSDPSAKSDGRFVPEVELVRYPVLNILFAWAVVVGVSILQIAPLLGVERADDSDVVAYRKVGSGIAAVIRATDSARLQQALADEVFIVVQINPEGRVKVARGPGAAKLVAGRPKRFLVRVENASGGQQLLKPLSRYVGASKNPFTLTIPTFGKLTPELVGHPVEYRLLEITCGVSGRHEVSLILEAGQGSQDLGFRAEVPVLFTVAESPR